VFSQVPHEPRQGLSSRRRFLKRAATAGGAALMGAAGLNEVSPVIWREPTELELNHSYWMGSQPPQNPPLSVNLTVDVAVIGGGLTGLSTAYFIRSVSPHKEVVVLEGRGCGNGASGRNGAMVLTMTEDRYLNFSSDPAMDKKIYDLTAQNLQTLSKLSVETGIDCELETKGALQVLLSSQDVREAKDYVQRAQSLGMPVELWDKQKIVDALGTDVYEGGFFDPGGGQVNPMKLVHVFKVAAESAGAKIFENTMVGKIEEGSEHLIYTTAGHTVRAKALVLATNAFTSRLGFFRNAVAPIREYVAMTRRFTDQELIDIGWRLRVPFNDSRTEVFYLGVTQDNRIHIGGGSPGYSFNNGHLDPAAVGSHSARLQRELVRIYPKLSGIGFEATWDGVVDWSLNESPSVGCSGKYRNIFHGLGYSGHGVNLASVFGRIIADLDAGRGDRWKEYPFVNANLDYIPNEPIRWFAVRAGLAWYNLIDS